MARGPSQTGRRNTQINIKEPAWHRRERRRRTTDRLLVRIAAAKGRLADHHSAQRVAKSDMVNGDSTRTSSQIPPAIPPWKKSYASAAGACGSGNASGFTVASPTVGGNNAAAWNPWPDHGNWHNHSGGGWYQNWGRNKQHRQRKKRKPNFRYFECRTQSCDYFVWRADHFVGMHCAKCGETIGP